MTDWFRSWHGAPTDVKWLDIADKAGVIPGVVNSVWYALQDYASQHMKRGSVTGFQVGGYARFTGFPREQVAAVIKALTDDGVITTDGRLAAWDKRQPKREDPDRPPRTRAAQNGASSKVRRGAANVGTAADTTNANGELANAGAAADTAISDRVESLEEIDTTTTTSRESGDFLAKLVKTAGNKLADIQFLRSPSVAAETDRWLAGGCDVEADILPTVRLLAERKSPGAIKTWEYFSDAVFKARDKRLSARAPPPPVIAIADHRPQQRSAHGQSRKTDITDALLREAARTG